MAAEYGRLSSQEERKFTALLADITAGVSYKMTLNPASPSRIKDKRRFHLAAQTVLAESLETILDHSMLPGVMKISHLSRGHRAFVLEYLRRRIDNHLQTWFNDPARFRDMLRATSSIVSGSTVLAFALGEDWGVQDLDIYVGGEFDDEDAPAGDCAKLLRYLVEVEGFRPKTAFGEARDVTFDEIVPTPAPTRTDEYGEDWGPEAIRTVYKLVRERSVPGYEEPITVHIDVIECAFDNPVRIISEFHSTQVMNWMSADNITTAYPVLTFAMKGVVKQNRLSFDGPKDPLWKEKYTARGFKIFDDHNTLIVPCGTSCTNLARSSYDIGCMRMPYGQGSVVDQFEETHWSLKAADDRYTAHGKTNARVQRKEERKMPPTIQREVGREVNRRPEAAEWCKLRGKGEETEEGEVGRQVKVPLVGEEGEEQVNCRPQATEEGMEQVSLRVEGGGEEEVNRTFEGVGGGGQPQSPVGRGGHPQARGREGEVNLSLGGQGEEEVNLPVEVEGEIDLELEAEGDFTLKLNV
ncbi:hypothetical protein FS837_000628 [Tulasnella sp. UAMH 9824]|nr:hypothetical protein FS837_000628 [Tulasnella sp. UAMH 9824]